MMLGFKQKVLRFIKSIPKGKVASYGQVAAACGKPKGARETGWILRSLDASKNDIPWWRVVNQKGEISIKGNWVATKELQAQLLRKEGVKVGKDFILNIKRYQYQQCKSRFSD